VSARFKLKGDKDIVRVSPHVDFYFNAMLNHEVWRFWY